MARRAGGGLNPRREIQGKYGDRRGKSRVNFVTAKKENARKIRRTGRAGRRIAKKGARAKRVATVRKARAGEVKIGTWNVRTMAINGVNGAGHANTLMIGVEKLGYDVIGLQETKRPGYTIVPLAGYDVYFNGSKDSSNHHGVGFAVRKSFVGEGEVSVENTSERMMKVRIQRAGTDTWLTFIVAYAPTECASVHDKAGFWTQLDKVTAQTSPTNQLFILMDANARTGERDSADSKVVGAYGRDVQNDNGTLLIRFAEDRKLFAVNTCFSTRKGGQSHTFHGTHDMMRYRLDYVLMRQADRRLVRTAHVNKIAKKDSDHSIVHVSTLL